MFGVNVIKGSRAFLESNVIQNWARGAFIDSGAQVFSSNDVFQSNGGSAIVVLAAAYFESLNSSLTTTVLALKRAERPDTQWRYHQWQQQRWH